MKRLELILMMLQLPVDFAMLMLAAATAYGIRFMPQVVAIRPVVFSSSLTDFLAVAAVVALGWMVLFAFAGLYTTDPNRKLGTDLLRVAFACSAGLAIVAIYVLFRLQQFDSRFLVATSWMCAIVYVSVGRILLRGFKSLFYRMGMGLRRVVVIGNDAIKETIVAVLKQRQELGYAVVGEFDSFESRIVTQVLTLKPDEIIYANPRANEQEALAIIDFCNEHHIVCKYTADLFSTYTTNMAVSALAGIPVMELKPTRLEGWGRVVKRFFDVVISLGAVVLLSPLLVLVAGVIALESGRPVFYKNERVGKFGKPFFALKFRSMYQKYCTGPQFPATRKEAEQYEEELIAKQNTRSGPIYKIGNDPRVTRVGRFLRRFSLDELPQFFNVLGGSMSIVGPRPHQPREVARYGTRDKQVLSIRPGITGLAQISGRSDLSFAEEMRLDVLYLERWSWWQDVIICLKTPFLLFKKRRVE